VSYPRVLYEAGVRFAWAGNTVGQLLLHGGHDAPGYARYVARGRVADVLAYISQLIGMPAGAEPLPADVRELNTNRIELPR